MKNSEYLNETYELFKSQGVSILGKSFEEVMSSPALHEAYVQSMVEGASADSAVQMAQLMVNTNAELLSEGSVAGIAPISSLSGPIIRKLWPTFAMKNAVKTDVAKTPSFLIAYTRPYYVTAGKDGEEVRHYVPRPGLVDADGIKDLTSLSENYIVKTAEISSSDVTAATTSVDFNVNNKLLLKDTASKIKRQPLDADFTLVSVTVTPTAGEKKVFRFDKKLGVENVIVAEKTFFMKDKTNSSMDTSKDANLTLTILVRTDLLGGKAIVSAMISSDNPDYDNKVTKVEVELRAHRSSEYNEVATSWSFDIAREDIRIGTGEHMNAPLPIESLTDMKALYQIDGTKEAVDLMTNAMALRLEGQILSFLKENFLSQPGHGEFTEAMGYPAATEYTAVFDVKPAVGFAAGPKAWREELKPVIDHLAARIKNNTYLGTGVFNIIGNPLDIQLITNIDWQFRGGQQTVDGVSVNYSLGTYYGSAYAYKIVSSEIVPQGYLYIDFIPETTQQMTYNYWAYTFSTELGYRDPNRALVPSVMLCKRDVMKSFLPAIAMVRILGNDAGAGYDPFRTILPTTTGEGADGMFDDTAAETEAVRKNPFKKGE